MINVKKINSRYNQLCNLISSKKIKDALDILNELIAESAFSDFFVQQEHLESTYEQMLRYTLEGVHDPEREKVYQKLQVSILKLADKVRAVLLMKNAGWHTFTLKDELEKKQKLTGKGVIETLDDLAFRIELDEIINEDKTTPKTSDIKRRELVMEIFKHLWLTDSYFEAENSLVNALVSCRDFTWYEQSLQVSAILLSGLRYWDEQKIHRLIDFAEMEDPQVSGRALVALVILLYTYDKRLHLYPSLIGRLEIIKDSIDLDKILEQIVLQINRSRDTLELGKKLQEDIIPEMVKLKPKLEDKLKMDDLEDEDGEEKRNPDWESVFEESDDLYQKVDEFMKLQMEGADVYMTTFSMLKNFPFFNELTNWLVPFYEENQDLSEVYEQETEGFNPEMFIAGLKKMPFLCNSDKYSFIFNVRFLPEDQKKILSSAFQMEMEGLAEMVSDEELMSGDFVRRTVFVQYIQDLYRFFKLSPFKNEFEDVFTGKLDMYYASFFNSLISDKKIFRNIAEYFFEKGHYEEALDIFRMLLEEENENPELLEKAGFCQQRMEHFNEALGYYDTIDLSGKSGTWVLRNMGLCYRKLENYDLALDAYKRLSSDIPDDPKIETLIAYCNLKLENYDIALQQYFKIEYQDPKNTNIIRPIAWCYFALGDLEKSAKYFEKVFEANPDYYDYVNYGHVKWALGDRKSAIENYVLSSNYSNFSLGELHKIMEDDKALLLKNGVDADEVPLMMDFLRYSQK